MAECQARTGLKRPILLPCSSTTLGPLRSGPAQPGMGAAAALMGQVAHLNNWQSPFPGVYCIGCKLHCQDCTCLIPYLVHPFATGSVQVNVVQTIPLKSFVDNVTLVWLACVVGAKDTLFRNLHLFLETGQATVIMVSCLQIS